MTPIRRLAIIGVGLIGGSLARALREAGAVQEIVGGGRSRESLERAQALGVIDRYALEPEEAVADAEVVVLAMPVGATAAVYAAMQGGLRADAVVTDVGSTKSSVMQAIQDRLGTLPPRFVPAHPVAGTEKSGVSAAFATLFQGRRVILTPTADTDPDACARVREMWQACGAEVSQMSAAHHDEVLAATSHLPHLLAFALVDCLATLQESREVFTYAAGGFRDFTRIAASHPEMWADICSANAPALLAVLDRFETTLGDLRQAVEQGARETLVTRFARARGARQRFAAMIGDPHALDGATE